MKVFWKEILACAVMGIAVPGMLLEAGGFFSPGPEQIAETAASETESLQTEAALAFAPAAPAVTMQLLKEDGTGEEMEMDEYLVGVVLAEMPAYFEPEALKAQSVAARTYTRKTCLEQDKHAGSVCTDFSCCQAYISQEDYIARGGTEEGIQKIREAVQATSGMVLTYGGSLIEATYFSCSGGSTEDAAAVWGAEYPYLKAVASPGEENAEFYEDTVLFSPESFNRALGTELTGSPAQWIGEFTRTPGGGVDLIHIGGKTYEGRTLRRLLGLRSTAFTMTGAENGVAVTTRGFGHRVGMSQYGADAMAASGSSYQEILAHYYQGAVLEKIHDSIA